MLTDIHSHSSLFDPNHNKVFSILLHPETDIVGLRKKLHPNLHVSIGAHPWYASEWNSSNLYLLESKLSSFSIPLIGEIGLDNACGIPFETQLQVFEKQLLFAEQVRLPVLIHNIGHQEAIMALKKKYSKVPTWIIHGFRGKEQEARQYLQNGFHLSFGLKFHIDSLRICPMNRLFLETDESNVELEVLYNIVAKEKSIAQEHLEQQVHLNFESILRK